MGRSRAADSRGEASPRGRVDRGAQLRPRGPRGDARPSLLERARVRSRGRPGRGARSPNARVLLCARRATAPTASPPGGSGAVLRRGARAVARRRSGPRDAALPLRPGGLAARRERGVVPRSWRRRETSSLRTARASRPRWPRSRSSTRTGSVRAPDRAREHLRRSEELIEGAPPSRPKAFVLSQIARFAMLSDEDARAVEVARETLAMVDELDASNELRAQALNIIGPSRTKLGDREGLKDLERCIEITSVGLLRTPARLHQSRLDAERARRAPAQLRGARRRSARGRAFRQLTGRALARGRARRQRPLQGPLERVARQRERVLSTRWRRDSRTTWRPPCGTRAG